MAGIRRFEQWQDLIGRLFPEYREEDAEGAGRVLTRSVTFQVTDACNLCCSYCYQINKGHRKMSIETAKKFIDLLLSGEKGMSNYINPEISPGIVLDFIGGEPFLEVELIDQIVSYFEQRAIEMMHPWATKYMISICSNGVLYSDPRVQAFLNKHKHHMSFSVTIDGNKQLHDSCRVFHDGSGSYDLAVAAAKDWMDKGGYMGSKITIAPGNITYLYDALVHMVELGYQDINANCVYEEGWNAEHATELYNQMKKVSDYFLDNNLDFSQYYCSLYEPAFFRPKSPDDNNNWCFKAGTKVLTPSGNVNIEDLKIGDEVITGRGNIKPVINNMSRFADDTAIVKIAGIDPVFTTAEHPFLAKHELSDDPEWIAVQDLKSGDYIALYNNGETLWKKVAEIDSNVGGYEVYNLTVADEHTFIANGVIVHNCGGTGMMISCDPDGFIYPCIRYMESSLGTDQKPLRIGDVDNGVGTCTEHKCTIDCLQCITRRSQSTDECFYCPIAEGCSWCSAYNYQVYGTPNARATFICIMHKARALANVYFWNKYYRKRGEKKYMKNYVPDEWALEIIDEDELNMLKELSTPPDGEFYIQTNYSDGE